jgi:hypothetical protein
MPHLKLTFSGLINKLRIIFSHALTFSELRDFFHKVKKLSSEAKIPTGLPLGLRNFISFVESWLS